MRLGNMKPNREEEKSRKLVKINIRIIVVHQMSKAIILDQNSMTIKTDMLKAIISKNPTVNVPSLFLTQGQDAQVNLAKTICTWLI